jgi:hypothetical protein
MESECEGQKMWSFPQLCETELGYWPVEDTEEKKPLEVGG